MKRLSLALTAAVLYLAGGPSRGPAQEPVVPGFQRFFAGDKADAAHGGQLLLGELNCTSCHAPATDAAVNRKQAPILDHVGARVRVSHLKKFLADPQATKPGTTMPNVFGGDTDKTAKIEALVHFLATTGTPRQERPDFKAVTAGRDLYSKVGCVACHGPRDARGLAERTPAGCVPLGDLKGKYTISSLAAFLGDPLQTRPSGRMPHLLFTAKEAHDVAHYLIQGVKVDLTQGATTYAYYEGSWTRLPDFDKLKPVATGTGAAFHLGVARRGGDYGVRFEGFFKADRAGTYTFLLNSDDGSRLYVDGKQVVNNDGVHPPQGKSGKIKLTKGVHQVTVGFFQAGGGIELSVEVEGPGLGRQPLGGLVAATAEALNKKQAVKQDEPDFLDVQPALVAKGRALFASAGCASCHQLNEGGKTFTSTLTAAPLNQLKGAGGCLSAAPAKGSPWYALSGGQRTALAAALKKPPQQSKEPAAVIARTMTTFNCYACHSRAKVGGPMGELDKLFTTAQPEMGDEGRVPPPLDGVGAKLNPAYLKQILDWGTHDRPYMHTRMPGFGLANVGPFADAVAAIDKVPAAPEVKFDNLAKAKSAGRHMVGVQGFGCIKCHTFNGVKAEGIQGIDMTLMPKRLQRDWYHAYVLDPQRIRPGTRMPTGWPDGQSTLPKLLDGKAATQIEAIWVYLKDGKGAKLPIGMGKQYLPLTPISSAIIYRNFIAGAGSRAIGVGYPEKVNLAFDANDVRLALLWQGAFIDAARHWTDRGVGFEGPLGDNILKLPPGVPFAALGKGDAAWPTTAAKAQGYRFKGYRLTPDDRPTFLYSFGGVTVEDFPNPAVRKETALLRTLTLTATQPPADLYFRAAVGSKIEALERGWYRVDGYRVRIEGGGAPQVRQSGGRAELLVPLRFDNGKAQVVQEIAW